MPDIHITCRDCRATIITTPPDAFGIMENGITLTIETDATNIAEATQAAVDYFCEVGCPHCGGHDLDLANVADEN